MVNELQTAFNEIAELRALPSDVVLEALQSALVSAYRRDSGASSAQAIEARIDPTTGRASIFVEKEVTEDVISPATEVLLEDARFYHPEAQIGDTVMVQIENTTRKFGRIAAQTAKQVILQKIREAERNALYDEFISREGDLITGTVQSINSSMVTLSLGRAEAILPRNQQIPNERYRQHEKLRVLLLEVKRSNRGPQIVCSRSHRSMLRRLLEYEVPEIYNGQVEIKSIAREAGHRSKVGVAALQEGIDPVGACVGMRGIRIQNIVKELHDEKIDVIEWDPVPETFIARALSPARVTGVYLDQEDFTGRTAVVVVPDDQLSLAIGREGQNARLAAKLTNWRIDIKSVTETVQSAIENIDLPPLNELVEQYPVMLTEVMTTIDKKANNLAIMPEEFSVLARFADIVETRLLQQREELRQEEEARIQAVRETIAPELFKVPVDALATLPEETLQAIEPMESVGEVMLAALVDERQLKRLTRKLPDDPLADIQEALDFLVESGIDFAELIPAEETEDETSDEMVADEAEDTLDTVEAASDETETDVEAVETADVAETVGTDQETTSTDEVQDDEEEEEVILDAFGGVVVEEEDEEEEAAEDEIPEEEFPDYDNYYADYTFDDPEDDFDDEDDDDDDEDPSSKKKARRKRRRLVYDEDSGEVIAKRRRKSNRKRNNWRDEYDY